MENVSPSKPAMKWTLIGFFVSVILTYIWQFAHISLESPVKYISYILFIAFLVMSQKEYRGLRGGYMTFGQAFVEGLLFAVFYGILSAIFSYIYMTILSPQVWEQAMVASQQKLEAAGNLSSEQIESAMAISRKYGILIAVVVIILGTPFMGAIVSLIGAAVLKKDPQPLDISQNNNYSDPAV